MFVATAISGDDILTALWSFLLTLDGLVYNLICYVTNIFDALIKLNLFSNSGYTDLVKRFYVVLGLIMLFALAYSLLKAIINPENFSKGETSFSKLIGNTVSSLIIIAVLPTVFSVAFNIQNSLVNQGTIYNLIIGNNTENNTKDITMNNSGRYLAYYTFRSFLLENPDSELCSDYDDDPSECDELIKSEAAGETLKDTNKSVLYNNGSFTLYNAFAKSVVVDKSLIHYFPISFLAGLFILYILLNFCFDVAVRVVKLAFYQIIAPIPVMCRIIPGGKMKDVFSKWLKQVISLFVEVFIRMAALAFGVFFLKIILQDGSDYSITDQLRNIGLKFYSRTFVKALLIMAIVVFIRQIPKIIGDMFGLDTAGMKLGLTDKLAMGGAFAVAGAAGSLVTSHGNPLAAVRGFRYGWKNKDLKVIGREANNRKAVEEAIEDGASRSEIIMDRMRRHFGFNTKFEQEVRKIDGDIHVLDSQIAQKNEEIDLIKKPLLDEHVSDRIKGNKNFNNIKDAIEKRAKDKLWDKKSNYISTIEYEVEVEYDTGLRDNNGKAIMGTRTERRVETGNLKSLEEKLKSSSSNMTSAQITAFNQKLAANEKELVAKYVNDNDRQIKNGQRADDSNMESLIANIRSNGTLNQVLVDQNGVSQLSAENREQILNSENLWETIDDLGGTVSDSVNDLERYTNDIDQQAIEKEYELSDLKRKKQELEYSKHSSEITRYKISSDVASKAPGEAVPRRDGRMRGPRGGHGPGPGGPDDFGPGPGGPGGGPGGPGPGGMP